MSPDEGLDIELDVEPDVRSPGTDLLQLGLDAKLVGQGSARAMGGS
jgi:hypothetical protein